MRVRTKVDILSPLFAYLYSALACIYFTIGDGIAPLRAAPVQDFLQATGGAIYLSLIIYCLDSSLKVSIHLLFV